jgi:hypothetical protein
VVVGVKLCVFENMDVEMGKERGEGEERWTKRRERGGRERDQDGERGTEGEGWREGGKEGHTYTQIGREVFSCAGASPVLWGRISQVFSFKG